MSISASQIVSVVPRTITSGGTDLEITGLYLTENPLCIFPGTLEFSSASAVGEYFGTTSNEYTVATKYFLGYDNSFQKPSKVSFSRLVNESIAGCLIGGSLPDLADLQEITNGAFSITIDGETKNVTGLDLSGYTTQSTMAQAIADAIGGVTIEYNSNLNVFIITSNTTGDNSNVSFAENEMVGNAVVGAATIGVDEVANLLGLTEDAGATKSEGSTALTPSANMESIISLNQNWVTFTTMEEQENNTVIEFAEWTTGTDCEYLYCPYTSKTQDTNPNNSTNLPTLLTDGDYEGVLLTYGGIEHATLAMSIGACIDWDRTNGLVDWAFKSQDGLSASVEDDTVAENCVNLGVNFYGSYATRNDNFIFYYRGKMIGGDFGFVDAYIGNLWLRNALQVSIMEGFTAVSRVPYNEQGYTLIRAWCTDPINRALTNGVINTGVTLSTSQKAQLINEIGSDVSDTINTDGYYLQIEDAGATVRTDRDSPTVGLWYTYGGSVQKLEVPVTAIL